MKKHTCSILFIFYSTIVFSQKTDNWNWISNAQSTDHSDGFSISNVVNSHVYVCGEFSGKEILFGETKLLNAGDKGTNDIFIAKYDLAGNLDWVKSIGGAGNDFARSIAVDASEHIYIAGGYTSAEITFGNTVLKNADNNGTHDIYVARYEPDGTVTWAKSIGGKLDDKANCIAIDKAGSLCVTGWFGSGNIIVGSDTIKNASEYGNADVFVLKLSESGTIIWTRSATGANEDLAYGIATDAGNNIYVTGGSSSPELNFNGIKIANSGYEKIFLAKYAPDGKLLSAQSIGGSLNAEGTSVTTDANGNVYITGKFSSASITMDSTTLTNAGQFDVYIAKYNPEGKVLWATSAGGSADDRGNSIITDEQGNVYITGWFASKKIIFGKTYLENTGDNGTTHVFIAKYSPEGAALWSECANGKGDDWGNGITADPDGNLYITGGCDGEGFSLGKAANTEFHTFYATKLLKR